MKLIQGPPDPNMPKRLRICFLKLSASERVKSLDFKETLKIELSCGYKHTVGEYCLYHSNKCCVQTNLEDPRSL